MFFSLRNIVLSRLVRHAPRGKMRTFNQNNQNETPSHRALPPRTALPRFGSLVCCCEKTERGGQEKRRREETSSRAASLRC
jgi:hypothetical protein